MENREKWLNYQDREVKHKYVASLGRMIHSLGLFYLFIFFRLARVVVELSLHNCCSTTVDVFVELVPRFVQFGLLTLNYLNLLCFSWFFRLTIGQKNCWYSLSLYDITTFISFAMIGMFFLSSDSMFTSSLHKNSVSFFSSQCRKLLISVRRWIEQFHKQYRFLRQGYRIYFIS